MRSCRLDCTFCGDGIVNSGEDCDDRNLGEEDGCSPECRIEACGNSAIDGGEQCDDGNLLPGDGCDAACRTECGNAALDAGEQCDDGNEETGDGCEPDCRCTDSDGDVLCNPSDSCPFSANPGNGVAPFGQTVRAATQQMFYWPDLADAVWVRGALSALPAYAVIESGTIAGDAVLWAPAVPAPGAGFYWLVRPACPLSSWSSMGPAECHGPPGCAPGGRDANLPF
jgi:cysteine-rich repeat protein